MTILYRHIRLDKNEPFYIGIGTDEKRAYNKSLRNNWWKKIVNKTDYEVQILFDDLTWNEACEKEKEFIALYGRKDLGTGTLVNLTDGGQGGCGRVFSHSDETKMKISNNRKGKVCGVDNFFYGKDMSKSNNARFGVSVSDETKKKMSNKKLGIEPVNKKIHIDSILYHINSGLSKKEVSILLQCDYGNLCRVIRQYKNKYELI